MAVDGAVMARVPMPIDLLPERLGSGKPATRCATNILIAFNNSVMSRSRSSTSSVSPSTVSGANSPESAVVSKDPSQAPKRMQMSDIARLAGVSSSTISRALSGHPGIPAQTRERIVEMARSLGYQVNLKAANLRTGRSQSVAVILSSAETSFTDPFTLSIISHLAATLDQRGQSLLLTRVNAEQPERMGHMVETGEVSGLIVLDQSIDPKLLNAMALRGIPIVGWGAFWPAASHSYAMVGSDNEQGAYLATRHLIEQGCRRIVCMGQDLVPEMRWREVGYQRALHEAGLPYLDELRVVTAHAPERMATQFSSWLTQGVPFDALFCLSDLTAIRAISILAAQGISVPAQVKVVGYDDIEMAAHLHPAVSSVRQPVELAAQAMVNQLFELLAGQPAKVLQLPIELKIRDSSS